MIHFSIVRTTGQRIDVSADNNANLKDIIQAECAYEMLALCGGSCSCATCHVFISSVSDPDWALSEDENDLLDGAPNRTPNSRLACQVSIDERLNGATVTVAPQV